MKRTFVNVKQNCFITLKDHNPNFYNKPTVRLLNLAENELSRISKTILDKINANLDNSQPMERHTRKKLSISSKALIINSIIRSSYWH